MVGASPRGGEAGAIRREAGGAIPRGEEAGATIPPTLQGLDNARRHRRRTSIHDVEAFSIGTLFLSLIHSKY